jgi:hypothetical protein
MPTCHRPPEDPSQTPLALPVLDDRGVHIELNRKRKTIAGVPRSAPGHAADVLRGLPSIGLQPPRAAGECWHRGKGGLRSLCWRCVSHRGFDAAHMWRQGRSALHALAMPCPLVQLPAAQGPAPRGRTAVCRRLSPTAGQNRRPSHHRRGGKNAGEVELIGGCFMRLRISVHFLCFPKCILRI